MQERNVNKIDQKNVLENTLGKISAVFIGCIETLNG
jgi:hypothetical protein